jgi:hypothetical protein
VRLITIQFDPTVAVEQLRGDRDLESSQGRAEALVWAVSEGEVRIGVAREVKAVGLLELLGVALCCGLHEVDEVTGRDAATAQLDLFRRPLGHELGRALIAQ